MKIIEMRQKIASLVKEMRELLDLQEAEKRDLTAEEEERYAKIEEDVDKLGARIEKEERLSTLEGDLSQSADEIRERDPIEGRDGDPRGMESRKSKEYQDAFARFLANGVSGLSSEEFRAMQADNDIGGGYLVTPVQMATGILKEVDDVAVIRQFATIHTLTKAASLGAVSLDRDADDAEWTAELKTGSETELGFGGRQLNPHPMAKRIKLSNTLIRLAFTSVEQLVRERLGYKFGITQEKAYMTGDGNQKPLGLFTASDLGISTSRDTSEGNTATLIKADALIHAKYELKGQYHSRARWIMHREIMREIRKMKNGDGQYLWQPGITGGAPDRILELPYTLSEYAPKTMTTGQYVAILGDFRFYWIVDALDMQIQRLTELYAETNQTGFIGRYEGDGMPVLEEAFVRLKLA